MPNKTVRKFTFILYHKTTKKGRESQCQKRINGKISDCRMGLAAFLNSLGTGGNLIPPL